MVIKVLAGQSLLDISNLYTGTVEAAFAISVANGISITDDIAIGSLLEVPDDITKEEYVLTYYKLHQIKPATAITKSTIIEPQLQGIGYWIINKTFKVN